MAINFLNTVAVDENVLFVDTVNDRVGIGTDSPSVKLEVMSSSQTSSTAKFDSIELQTYTVNNSWVGENLYYDGSFKYRADGYATALYFAADGFDIRTAPSGTAGTVATLTTAFTLLESSGNVGIGTTSPGEKLAVEGDASYMEITHPTATSYSGIKFSEGGTPQGSIQNIGSTFATVARRGNFEIFHNTGGNLTLQHSGGNVGIGTTSPSTLLEISGNSQASTPALRINCTDSSVQLNQVAGAVQFSVNDASTPGAGVKTSINSIALNTIGSRYGLAFNTTGSTNNVERMRIDSDGNVGIGTDSPSEKLDVNGNVKIKDALLSNQENTDIDTGAEVVAQVAHATYTAAFFDFVVKKGTNVRSGTVYACHNGDTTPLVEFTETSTNDLGDTSDVTLSVDISGTNMRLLATVTSDDWSVKSLIRAI
ncbi:hypothetical protein N9B25_01085 [bacterium]|nr:hypothetical protein [bacterium]